MKQKGWLVFTGFVFIFYIVVLIQDMPNLVNGHAAYSYVPETARQLIRRLFEIAGRSAFPLCAYFALLKFYPSRQIVAAGLSIAAMAAVVFFLLFIVEPKGTRLRFYFLSNVFYFLLYTLYGIVFFLVQYASFKEIQANVFRTKQRESELLFLRSQINPHFLFNSLNNIYALVYQKSDKALDSIAGFSDLMRYMLYDATENISLSDEINYIRKFISLQQLRFEQEVKVRLNYNGEEIEKQIPPLIFIPFVENAFKHGQFTGSDAGLIINIVNSKTDIYFFCSNKINNNQKDLQGGIGIVNVQKRLELLYHGKHELLLKNDGKFFTVKLHIQHA